MIVVRQPLRKVKLLKRHRPRLCRPACLSGKKAVGWKKDRSRHIPPPPIDPFDNLLVTQVPIWGGGSGGKGLRAVRPVTVTPLNKGPPPLLFVPCPNRGQPPDTQKVVQIEVHSLFREIKGGKGRRLSASARVEVHPRGPQKKCVTRGPGWILISWGGGLLLGPPMW